VLLALTAFHDLNWDGARGHVFVVFLGRIFEFASGRCGQGCEGADQDRGAPESRACGGFGIGSAVVFVETGAGAGAS